MSIFVSTALAAGSQSGAPQGNPVFSTILMLVGFVLIFYFLIWRPQSRRAKQQKELLSSMKVSDEVVTSGGLIGRIAKLEEHFVTLEVSKGVEMKFQRNAVSRILPKGTIKEENNA